MASEDASASAPTQRPRLNLKPRDEARAKQLEFERQQHLKKSPFGEAKPREAVIASRVGKTEEEILKEEVKKEKLHLRLNPQQLEEKRAHEAAVQEIQDEISLESDDSKREVLGAELASRQAKLDALMERFEKMALETALSGDAPRVSQMRRMQAGQEAGGLGEPLGSGGLAVGGPPAGRYNPTQQYAGGGRGRGGYDYGDAPPRTGYQPTRNYGGRGGGEGGYAAQYEERGSYGDGGHRQSGYQRGGGRQGQGFGSAGGYQPARGGADDGFGEGFDRQGNGGGRYPRTASGGGGGYGDSSDQGFFDAPSLSAGGGSGYGGGGRGRGRGGSRGYDRDYGGRGSGYGEPYASGAGFGGGGGGGYRSQGMGIGGEIHLDETQDRF